MADQSVHEYLDRTIGGGDTTSALLARVMDETLVANEYVRVIGEGKGGLKIVQGEPREAVVVLAEPDPREQDPHRYGKSLIKDGVSKLRALNAIPIAYANVIDSRSDDAEEPLLVASGMRDQSLDERVVCLNGEFAVLRRMVPGTNAVAFMVGWRNSKSTDRGMNIQHGLFHYDGSPLHANADGIGTKIRLHQRAGKPARGMIDAGVMVADDVDSAIIQHISVAVEHDRFIDLEPYEQEGRRFSANVRAPVDVFGVHNPRRIHGYRNDVNGININAVAYSTINEELLKNPPTPKEGDILIAITGPHPTPRSNGISLLRTLSKQLLDDAVRQEAVEEWHQTRLGKELLTYATRPSTCMYPAFRQARTEGILHSSAHCSGGAWDTKVAKKYAKQGLFAVIDELYTPSPWVPKLMEEGDMDWKQMLTVWNGGTEAIASTTDPERMIEIANTYGLRAKVAGRLLKREDGIGGARIALGRFTHVEFEYRNVEQQVS